jgi:hypothetical protein
MVTRCLLAGGSLVGEGARAQLLSASLDVDGFMAPSIFCPDNEVLPVLRVLWRFGRGRTTRSARVVSGLCFLAFVGGGPRMSRTRRTRGQGDEAAPRSETSGLETS